MKWTWVVIGVLVYIVFRQQETAAVMQANSTNSLITAAGNAASGLLKQLEGL